MDDLKEVSIDDLLKENDSEDDISEVNSEGGDGDGDEDLYNYEDEEDEDEDEDEEDEDEDEEDEDEDEDEEDEPKFKDDDNINPNYKLPSDIKGGGKDDIEEEEEDEDIEDDDINYLQKFDTDIRENFIENCHPESKTHNFEEVKHMSRIVRNEEGIITDNFHKTLPFLTKYEIARILGQRAKQLNSGAKSFVKIPPNIIDGYEIAKLELEDKKIPFIIKRPIPDGTCEYWNVNDLEIL